MAADIENEQQRVGQWKIENIRRRHNYAPFIVNFLKARPRDAAERRPRRGGGRVPCHASGCEQVLAERGELGPLVEQAKKKQRHGAR